MMFERTHGLGTGEIGTWLFGLGLFGMLGTFGGGYLCDKFGAKDERWYLWLPGIATLIHVPFACFTYPVQYCLNAKPARRIYIAGRGSSCCISTRVEPQSYSLTTLTLTVTSLDTAPSRSVTV